MKTKERTIQEKICPLEIAVNSISGKWKIPIIWHMKDGKKRPSEFVKAIGLADRRVLNEHLKEMEADGIINREVFNELPPRVEYTLTDLGNQLVEVLWSLNSWGEILLSQKKNAKE